MSVDELFFFGQTTKSGLISKALNFQCVLYSHKCVNNTVLHSAPCTVYCKPKITWHIVFIGIDLK